MIESTLRAAIEALLARWAEVVRECKQDNPRWFLDPSTMVLDSAHRELRAVLERRPIAHTPPTEPAMEDEGHDGTCGFWGVGAAADCTCGEFAGTSVVYADCPIHAPGAMPAPAPVARDAATLTDDEREAIYRAGDHHPSTCDCSAYVIEQSFAEDECCEGLLDTFAAVERILAARQPVATETEGEQA